MAADAARHIAQGFGQMRTKLLGEVAFDRGQGAADDFFLQTQKRRCVFTGLDDDTVGFMHKQQTTVWLDGSGEVDLLAFAVGKVRLSESWR